MEASFHATALLGVVAACGLAIWPWGTRPHSSGEATRAFFRGALTCLGAFAVLLTLVPMYLCGAGNNPSAQLWLPGVAAGVCAAFLPGVRARRVVIAALVGVGVLLGNHFHTLVLDPDRCAYTGEVGPLISNSCSCGRPARAVRLWHTPLTGIYALSVE